jgi:hypothetical protein
MAFRGRTPPRFVLVLVGSDFQVWNSESCFKVLRMHSVMIADGDD